MSSREEEYIAKVTAFATAKGLSQDEINDRISAFVNAGDEFAKFLEKQGIKEKKPQAMMIVYRALYNDIATESLVQGEDYSIRILNYNLKDFPEKDKAENKITKKDQNKIPMKDMKGRPIYETYRALISWVVATKISTGTTAMMRLNAFRDNAVNSFIKAGMKPLFSTYRAKFKESKDNITGEISLNLPQIFKVEEVHGSEFPDLTAMVNKIGQEITIPEIKVMAQKVQAIAAMGKPEAAYQQFRFSGSVLYSFPPNEGGKYGRIVMLDDFAVGTIDQLKEQSVTVMVCPELIKMIGNRSRLNVIGTIQWSEQWQSQCYADMIYPVFENGEMTPIWPNDEATVTAPGFDPSKVQDATQFASTVPEMAPQYAQHDTGTTFDPSPAPAPTRTTPQTTLHATNPVPTPVLPAPAPSPAIPAPSAKKVCHDKDVDCDPDDKECRGCGQVVVCLNNSIQHLSKKLGEVPAGSDQQMRIMAKLQKLVAAKETIKPPT